MDSIRPCKFGASCTRADCWFAHPEKVLAGGGSTQKGKKPCRDGASCTRTNCWFAHPEKLPAGGGSAQTASKESWCPEHWFPEASSCLTCQGLFFCSGAPCQTCKDIPASGNDGRSIHDAVMLAVSRDPTRYVAAVDMSEDEEDEVDELDDEDEAMQAEIDGFLG